MAQRKLQQEMDRVFKKVAEGVQTFDAIYDKVQSSSNQSQKEKLESDLKREIKKLQRLRDQIKTWMGSNDIKDKKTLTEQRKLIESEMERFKACEKEMKTKAYSKEGLTNLLKLDPREKEKQEMCDFLANTLEELENQTDNLETEQESLQATMKKGRKDNLKAERIGDIEATLERHKWHQSKLELILRLLENGQIATEQVENIQEDIKYYVESNQEVDFADDEEIYDELNLDQDEDLIGMDSVDIVKDEGVSTLEELAADLSLSGIITREGESQSKPESPIVGLTPRSSSMSLSTSSNPHPTKLSLKTDPKLTSAASSPLILSPALKSSSTSLVPTSLESTTTSVPNAWAAPDKIEALKIKGHNESPPASKSVPVSATTTNTTTTPSTPAKELFIASESTPKSQNVASSSPHVSGSYSTGSPAVSSTEKFNPKLNESPLPPSIATTRAASPTVTIRDSSISAMSDNDSIISNSSSVKSSNRHFNLPPGLQDFVQSFEAARQRVENPPPISSIIKLLESSYENIPTSVDADIPNYYRPVNPYPTASYYPQQPITYLRDASLLEKMSIDTLLYIFYYKQGTYDQYLAAKELKRRSWRYHKKFLTWFQRHEEPSVINDEYEQGSYVYFDYEGMWTQRKKSNFQFAYEFLEDEI